MSFGFIYYHPQLDAFLEHSILYLSLIHWFLKHGIPINPVLIQYFTLNSFTNFFISNTDCFLWYKFLIMTLGRSYDHHQFHVFLLIIVYYIYHWPIEFLTKGTDIIAFIVIAYAQPSHMIFLWYKILTMSFAVTYDRHQLVVFVKHYIIKTSCIHCYKLFGTRIITFLINAFIQLNHKHF